MGNGATARNGSVLVIDDEEIMREILETLLTREGYDVRLASSGAEGVELAKSSNFDVAIVDVMMPGMDGLETLAELKKVDDDLPAVMITAFASVETAIAAMKSGAFDYITKPFKNDEVLVVLRNASERRRLVAENRALRQNLQAQTARFAGIIGRSPRMKQVFNLIIQAAPSRSTILITGESGTGKELVARAIHTNSPRAERAFVTVNSGNLPPDLLESTLFGHVKGAFTGAVNPKKGLFDMADKGSIFFDEIGNISPETQAKLLRVMQEREFMRLGGMETKGPSLRVEWEWMALATSSLPVPLSPVMSTVVPVGATDFTISKRAAMAWDTPMMRSNPWRVRSSALSSRFSSRSSCRSSALRSTMRSSSTSKGLTR